VKTSWRSLALGAWQVLTEVPGWPEASFGARLWRALPVALPVLGAAGLTVLVFGWQRPRHEALRAAYAPAIELDREVAGLRLAFSDLVAAELAETEATLRRQLAARPADLRALLAELPDAARRHGWNCTVPTVAIPSGAPGDEAGWPEFFDFRARLVPSETNSDPIGSLLQLLERLRQDPRQIVLRRLAVGADVGQRHTVEAAFRLPLFPIQPLHAPPPS
jgi:hypothetical protein